MLGYFLIRRPIVGEVESCGLYPVTRDGDDQLGLLWFQRLVDTLRREE